MEQLRVDDRCRNCRFFHRFLRKVRRWDGKLETVRSSCCIALAIRPEYDAPVVETNEGDFCERFRDR